MNVLKPTSELETHQTVIDAICRMGFRFASRALPLTENDPTTIFRAKNCSLRITRIKNAWLVEIDILDGNIPKTAHAISMTDIPEVASTLIRDCDLTVSPNEVATTATMEPNNEETNDASTNLTTITSIELLSYKCSLNSKTCAKATVEIIITTTTDHLHRTFEATGNGPIDAVITAINKGIPKIPVSFESLHIESNAAGTFSLGAATVVVKISEKQLQEGAVTTDIIDATIKAYLKAINRSLSEK